MKGFKGGMCASEHVCKQGQAQRALCRPKKGWSLVKVEGRSVRDRICRIWRLISYLRGS